MASTDQVRNWYPEVVLNHAQRCQPGYEPICDPVGKATKVLFPREGGGDYSLWVHPKTKEAWKAYVQTMRHHGETVPPHGGTHNCRNIGTGDCPSLHAYCTALDLPPNSRKSVAFQTAVLNIRTKSGVRVFKNLANIDDRMHDQIDCSPADLATGIDWSTVPGAAPAPPQEDEMALKRGDGGVGVRWYQEALLGWNPASLPQFGADGDFGAETETAVKNFQAFVQVPQTGIIDGALGMLLGKFHPELDQVPGVTLGQVDQKIATHAQAKASSTVHTHKHDEGETGAPI